MPNNGFNIVAWYEQMVSEKARLETELGRVSKLTEALASFVDEDKSRNSNTGKLLPAEVLSNEFEQLATLNKKIQVLYFLLDVIRSLSAETDTERRYRLIMEKGAQLINGDRSLLFLHNSDSHELCAKVPELQKLEERTFPDTIGIAGQAIKTGKVVNVTNTRLHTQFNAEIDEEPVYKAKNLIAAPIRDEVNGAIMGVLEVYNKQGGVFTADDEYLLQGFAAQTAMVLKSTHADPDTALTVSNTMLVIMKALSSGLDTDSLLQSLMKKTTQVTNADRSTLFLTDFATKELWSKVAEGSGVSEIRFPMGAGIAGHVATTGETVNIPDAYEDPRFNKEIDKKTGYTTRTILCAPLKNENGKVIGAIQVLNKKEGTFEDHDERLIHAFATQVSKVLKSAQFLLNLIAIMESARATA